MCVQALPTLIHKKPHIFSKRKYLSLMPRHTRRRWDDRRNFRPSKRYIYMYIDDDDVCLSLDEKSRASSYFIVVSTSAANPIYIYIPYPQNNLSVCVREKKTFFVDLQFIKKKSSLLRNCAEPLSRLLFLNNLPVLLARGVGCARDRMAIEYI